MCLSTKQTNKKAVIPGAHLLGSGFDVKHENNENSRRRNLVLKQCNYDKR